MVLLWLLLCYTCYGAVFEGTVFRKNAGFWFLGKFAFENHPVDFVGTIDMNLSCSTRDLPELQGLEVLLYDDAPNSLPSVYQKSLNCNQWRQAAINWDSVTGDVLPDYKVSWNMTVSSNTSWHEKPYISQAARPRYWYVVLSSCDSNGTGFVKYHVHFFKYSTE